MGYREVGRMEVWQILRRWQAGESRRAISRTTVDTYILAARAAGLEQGGPPLGEELLRRDAALYLVFMLVEGLSRNGRALNGVRT